MSRASAQLGALGNWRRMTSRCRRLEMPGVRQARGKFGPRPRGRRPGGADWSLFVAADSLTPAVKDFIARHVKSVEQLEILCLVSAQPTRRWLAAEVFRAIQSSEKSVSDSLQELHGKGLLTAEGEKAYRFAPNSSELAQQITDLVAAYRGRRVAVIEAIYARPTDAIQNFADAFKLRKEK